MSENGLHKLMPVGSFISVDHDNIIIETVKLAEDGKGIIIRFYESMCAYLPLTSAHITKYHQDFNNLEEKRLFSSVAAAILRLKNRVYQCFSQPQQQRQHLLPGRL